LQLFIWINNRVYYGWIIVAALIIISTIMVGTRNSFGVFFKPLANEFFLNRATTSAIFSSFMILSAISAIGVGWILDRYGPRLVALSMGLLTGFSLLLTSQTSSTWQLFVAYSLLLALGTGAAMPVAVTTVKRWFDKRRGFVLGITSSATGLGPMVIAPFAAYLIANLGWRMSYVVLGFVAWSVTIPLSLILVNNPAKIHALPNGEVSSTNMNAVPETGKRPQRDGLTLSEALRTKSFWLIYVVWFFLSTCLHLVWTHIVPHATDIGIDPIKAATIISIVGGANILSRVLTGRVLDIVSGKVPGMIGALLLFIALVFLVWAKDLWMLYLFALIYGIGWGVLSTVVVILITDNFGGPNLGLMMGTMQTAFALGAAIGPAMGGLVFDAQNSYIMAFLAASAIMFISIFLITKPETRQTNV
jgi:MFS family permease